jgi:hypothetical protein
MRKAMISLVLGTLILVSCSPQSTWTLLHPSNNPPPLTLSGFAYDINSGEAVVFGGIIKDQWSDETWTWNGNDWRKADPPVKPSAREKVAMAYDEAHDRIVLFGGAANKEVFDDTWEWDGKDWQLMNPAHKPPARCCHAMAYDGPQKKVLLYGGWNQTTGEFFKDTWEWDGNDWMEVGCCNAPMASAHALVDFSSRKEIVALNSIDVFGMWVWDGYTWLNPAVNITPARQDTRLAYDSKYNRVVLFGGIRNGEYLNDTWIFDGTDWTELGLPIQPSARYAHVMFYDAKRQSIILFGGAGSEGLLGDTWELKLPQDLSPLIVHETPTP